MKPKTPKVFRAEQQTPAELIQDLMQAVRAGFYLEHPERWFKDQHFIKQHVVLWPAAWFKKKGVSIPPERYKEIVRTIILDIKSHVQQEIKYPPRYLLKSLQDHFAMHGDEYYEEAKSLRSQSEVALAIAQRATNEPRRADVVAALAVSHSVLAAGSRRKTNRLCGEKQMDLL